MKRTLLVLLCVLNFALLSGWLVPARAEPSCDTGFSCFPYRWDLDSRVHWRFDTAVPLGWRAEIDDGFDAWSNRVNGNAPEFLKDAPSNLQDPYTACAGVNGVFARNLAQDGFPNTLGVTPRCVQGGNMRGFTMVYDTVPNLGGGDGWYVGDGTVPSNLWDMQSIATHEVGHATGWYGHFVTTPPCGNSDRPTMCGGDTAVKGTKYLRTLESQDLNKLSSAYASACPPVCKRPVGR